MKEAGSPNRLPQKAALLVVSTGLLSEVTGFLTHQLNLGLGLLFLVCFTLVSLSSGMTRARGKSFWIGLAVAVISFISLRTQVPIRPLLISAYLLGLARVTSPQAEERRELEGMAVGAFSFGLFVILERNSPIVWSLVQSFSLGFSGLVGRLGPGELRMGSSFSGVHVLFLFVAFSVPLLLRTGKNRPLVICTAVLLLLAGAGVAMGMSHPLAQLAQNHLKVPGPGVRAYDRVLLSAPLLTLSLGLVVLWAVTRKAAFERTDYYSGRNRSLFCVACVLLFGSILALTLILPVPGAGSARLAFYSEGYFNWLRPRPGDYGSRSAGMFGNLPVFAEALGFEAATIDSINEYNLEGCKALFMANIDHELPAHSYEVIRGFVERGGSLLLLGDHTFHKEENQNWLNAVIAPFRIRYRFDSADYFIGGWLHSYLFPPSLLTANLGDEQNEVGVVVGASLDISYPAVPVIVGRYGYSDEGNPEGGDAGYIGDLEYARGERLGDLVLVAAQNYGKGKVIVFGDTSGFVNPLMVDTYVFVGRVFDWMTGDGGIPAHGVRLLISFALLTGFVVVISFSGLGPGKSLLLPVVTMAAALVGQIPASRIEERPLGGSYVLIDDSHLGRFPLEFWKPEGLMGLHLNLMRAGHLSYNMHEFEESLLAGSDLLVIVAPSRPYSRFEVEVLDEFARSGGSVFLCAGYEEKVASGPILRRFGFEIDNIPLGGFFTDVPGSDVSVYFREGWPVRYSGQGYRVLAGYGEYPTAVMKKHGKGKIVVFGDSSFFQNINLETEDEPFMPNIEFLGWLLEELDINPETM